MTAEEPQWGVQVNAWSWSKSKVCIDWRTQQVGWLKVPQARGVHMRILLDFSGPHTVPNLTLLAQRMTMFVLARKHWKTSVPRGCPFVVVGDDDFPVPPSGGEGGENAQLVLPGQDPLPGIDKGATIILPPPPVKQESAPEPKARGRSPRSDRTRGPGAVTN